MRASSRIHLNAAGPKRGSDHRMVRFELVNEVRDPSVSRLDRLCSGFSERSRGRWRCAKQGTLTTKNPENSKIFFFVLFASCAVKPQQSFTSRGLATRWRMVRFHRRGWGDRRRRWGRALGLEAGSRTGAGPVFALNHCELVLRMRSEE